MLSHWYHPLVVVPNFRVFMAWVVSLGLKAEPEPQPISQQTGQNPSISPKNHVSIINMESNPLLSVPHR